MGYISDSHYWLVIYHRGAFGVARFDKQGNSGASIRGTGTDGSTFLFCIWSIYLPYILIKNLASLGPRCSKSMNNMKTMKRFLALLLFFVAAMNVQTLSAQTNGDVNNDGSVNEADISAIIEIMKEANGVGPKKYYWYVGQENPASMTRISPIVDDTSSPGWRLIGTSVPTYSATNPLWNGDSNNIMFTDRNIYYIAVPNASIEIYNAANGSVMDAFTTSSEVTIDGVKYTIYISNVKARSFVYKIF